MQAATARRFETGPRFQTEPETSSRAEVRLHAFHNAASKGSPVDWAGSNTFTVRKTSSPVKAGMAVALLWSAIGLASFAQAQDTAYPRLANMAQQRPVAFGVVPNYGLTTDAGDTAQLVDGKLASGSPLWTDPSAVGWVGEQPVDLTIDLGAVEPIRGIAIHAAGGMAGVEWPASVQMYVSKDGNQFVPVGDLMQCLDRRPAASGYAAHWLGTDRLQTHGRYIRLVITPGNQGKGAYVMLDEIEVYRGDAGWLNQPLDAVGAPDRWDADWAALKWQNDISGIPEPLRPVEVRIVNGQERKTLNQPLQQIEKKERGLQFIMRGEAGRQKQMNWTAQLPAPVLTDNARYVELQFRAQNIRRTFDPFPLIRLQGLSGKSADSAVIVLPANMAASDGLLHTLITRLPENFILQQLSVSLVTESDEASLAIEKLALLKDLPPVFNADVHPETEAAASALGVVDLSSLLNGNLTEWSRRGLDEYGTLLDGASTLPTGDVVVSGIPFKMGAADRNLALMPQSKPTTEAITFLRQTVSRNSVNPKSRHDALTIDINQQVREVFLLLALSSPPIQPRGGHPYAPLRLHDIEVLSVELTYDQGEPTLAFPWSLADDAAVIPARGIGAYAIAADPARTLKSITLHNRQFGPDFAVAGVTLNHSDKALVPILSEVAAPEAVKTNAEPAYQGKSIEHRNGKLIIRNQWYECDIDLSDGFVIERYANRWNSDSAISLSNDSGLRIRRNDAIYTGRSFAATVQQVTEDYADLRLTSREAALPVAMDVRISVDASPDLGFAVSIRNTGASTVAVETCLPALAGVAIGSIAETRVFFPQYRAVDTADEIALRAPYGPEFVGQFMDIYSRAAGVGLMVRTDNPQQQMMQFALRKDAGGVSGGVHFPADYSKLAAGENRAYPQIFLVAHNGDWHAAFEHYRNWLRTWYKPFKAQDKDFFINAWEVACYRPSEKISWADAHVPGFITPDRKTFLTDETFAMEQSGRGHLPDIVHFFNWNYNDRENRQEWGVYSTGNSYAQAGGLESFRSGIANIQEKWNIPVSLYTLPDRFRISAMPDQQLARDLLEASQYQEMDTTNDASAAVRATGGVDGTVYPSIGDKRWMDFSTSDIVRLQKDTGAKLIYLDVFPRFSHLTSPDGFSPRDADMYFIKKLREGLPGDVAIWSEYPLTDVASQYADAALHYYFIDLNEVFARRYNHPDHETEKFLPLPFNLNRFAQPGYRLMDLPCYIEAGNNPSQVDAIFVNGEVFHENTWRLLYSNVRKRIDRAYFVKHEYGENFNSADPQPQVPTLVQGISANYFPGEKRNVWTFYNGRPGTYTGDVIAVPHQAGAEYIDGWNERPIEPRIENGMAILPLTIDPQHPGCIVQELR